MAVKRIKAEELQVGMYITEVSDAWAADSHLRAEGLVTRAETVTRIQGLGVAYLYIDTDKGADCPGSVPIGNIARLYERELTKLQREAHSDGQANVEFRAAKKEAVKIRSRALSMVGDIMKDVKMGNRLDVAAIDELAHEVVESLAGNQNALATMMRLRHKDQYLLEHSFSVAVLMGMLTRSQGYPSDAMQPLVLGALLHDIGKIRVPPEILNKPGRLTPDEWEEMKRHVDYGMATLADTPGISDTVKIICTQHHERLDGTGYPFKLAAPDISLAGRMGAVVDVYDAITADRVYHQGMAPTIALRKMLEWSGDHLDRDLVYQLIRCISIYPPGSLVLLQTGQVALVREINALKQNLPVIELVYDPDLHRRLTSDLIDLATADPEQYGPVVSVAEPAAYRLDLNELL